MITGLSGALFCWQQIKLCSVPDLRYGIILRGDNISVPFSGPWAVSVYFSCWEFPYLINN